MKKLFILLAFYLQLSHVVAQGNATIQQTENIPNWPNLLSNLDTSQITSGVLIDKVTTFANIINYNTTEINISNSSHFNQALSELYRASDQTRFVSLSELKNRTEATTANNSVDIGIINTTFHKLNFNEENPSAGGVTYNETTAKYVAVSGRASFIGKKINIVAPLKDYISGNSFNFNFKNNLIFNNATTAIQSLVVDFSDGNNPTTVISGGNIITPTQAINYNTSGAKTLKFAFTFSDNTTVTTYGYLYVNYEPNTQTLAFNNTNSPCFATYRERDIFTSTIPYKGYTESSPVYGKTEYTIFYSKNNTAKKMLKPLIIVDGFDPKDKRKVQDCDCEQDETCKLANSDISFDFSFIPFPKVILTFNPTKHVSIEDMMFYDVVLPNGDLDKLNLITELRKKGYDVIIINNPTYTTTNAAGQSVNIDGGADYIERNAMTLVSYIQSIKSQQSSAGSTEQLVLIGPSMGGQITRYALAYMEKMYAETNHEAWKHNARLWVSVDSPHLGANIPVGAQANIWFLADRLENEKAKTQYYEELNSVAGKQQIISQFQNGRETGYLNGNSFFTTYYNNLNTNGVAGSNGYPVSNPSFRKIAMVNGSLIGKKDASEQDTFLFMRGYIRGIWPFQSSTITLMRLKDNFMPASGQTGTVFKGDGQNSIFNIGFNHWNINFSHPSYELKVSNNSINGSLDVVPGGYFKTAKYIKDAVSDGLSEAKIRQETESYIENHSFISSFSALGHLNPNQNWGNPLDYNLICPSNKQTPFDSYYGEKTNTEHTSFTKEGVDWLMKELDGIPQLPHFPVQINSMQGPSSICVNTNTTYTFGDICKVPSAATWSVSGNLEIVSQTGLGVTVKGTYNGVGVISAVFQNGQVVEKEIWVGAPVFKDFNFINNTGVSYCLAPTDQLKMDLPTDKVVANFAGMTSLDIFNNNNWEWQRSNNLIILNSSTDKNTRTICPMGPGFTSFKVRAKNTCGWSEWYEIPEFEITALPPGIFMKQSANTFTVFPNPSNDMVYIGLKDTTKKPEKETVITGVLYDILGFSKTKVNIVNNKASFSVKGLNKGIYILKIYINNQVESHQISVE